MERTPITDEELATIQARADAAAPGPWGRYGWSSVDGVVRPMQGAFEAAPGLSIGSFEHTEPIARFSGYLHPLEANVEFVIHPRKDIEDLLAEVKRPKNQESSKTESIEAWAPEFDEPLGPASSHTQLADAFAQRGFHHVEIHRLRAVLMDVRALAQRGLDINTRSGRTYLGLIVERVTAALTPTDSEKED